MSTTVKFSVQESDHIAGQAGSDITLVEFGDYQCSHCGDAYTIIKKLQQQLGTRIAYVFKHFPLTDTHIYAKPAAIAAEAAALQNKFWEMHGIMYENQQKLGSAGFISFAKTIGLDVEKFKQDLRSELLASRVDKDFEDGRRYGVNFTPSYFINGNRFTGGSKDLYDALIK